jgi:streptogramin lyase
LWVVNTAESTVSKWDASTNPPTELARYRVGLAEGECLGSCCWNNNCNMPSRVAVDGNGDVYIANRGFGMQGTVTKIAGDRANCIDRNGNGMIDTSTGHMDVRPFTNAIGQPADECVIWTARVGAVNDVLRAITVDRGDARAPGGYVWVGAYNTSRFYKVDPRTGETLATVPVPVNPYGAVVTADGRLWIGVLDSAGTASIDTTALTVSAKIDFPLALRGGCGNSYGITADAMGRIWFAGWNCRDALGYQPGPGPGGTGGQWTRVDTTALVAGTAGRGITPGPDGYIYMAAAQSGDSDSRIVRWPASAFAPGATVPATSVTLVTAPRLNGPSGLGFDRAGLLWLAHYGSNSELVRYNPMSGATATFTGPNRMYSYSDFTGSVRRTLIPEGSFSYVVDTTCANPRLTTLTATADLPAGTVMTISARTAATVAGLATAMDVPIATLPPNGSPYDLGAAFRAAGVTAAQHVRLNVTMRAASSGATPALSALNVAWVCP